MKRIAVLLTEI